MANPSDTENDAANKAATPRAAAATPSDPTPPNPPAPSPDPSSAQGDLPLDLDSPPTSQQVITAVNGIPTGDKILFSIERFIEEASDFFGQPPFIVAGALHAVRVAGGTDLTREQARAAIDAWLEAPVI